jgi:hypothetical protein
MAGALALGIVGPIQAERIDGFQPSPYFDEQTLTLTPDDGVRVLVNVCSSK